MGYPPKGDSIRKVNGKITKEYQAWKAMKARCYCVSTRNVGNYTKNNIKVCDRWLNSFENFLEDMGKVPFENASLERIRNLEDYKPDNCKWIPVTDQPKNRESVKYFTYNNETLILKDWSRKLGIKYTTLYLRIFRNGLSFEDAINYTHLTEINGEYKTVKQWCEILELKYLTIIDVKQNNKHLTYKEILLDRSKNQIKI